jgi:hypothetical protein
VYPFTWAHQPLLKLALAHDARRVYNSHEEAPFPAFLMVELVMETGTMLNRYKEFIIFFVQEFSVNHPQRYEKLSFTFILTQQKTMKNLLSHADSNSHLRVATLNF